MSILLPTRDSYAITKLKNYSVTPILLINLNLPLELRYLTENFIVVGLILGPKKGKNIDSWLWPLVQEMLSLGKTDP